MDALFTINYGEYVVADKLNNNRLSVFIPSSRQEKGIDLILYKFQNGKNVLATVQVKQSKTYYSNEIIDVSGKKVPVIGTLWFKRFKVQNNADWFLLVGTRAIHPKKWKDAGINDFSWDPIILAFTRKEMKDFIDSLKQRKDPKKNDSSFYFAYDEKGNVYQTRGCKENRRVNQYLFEKRLKEISSSLK